MNDKDLIQKLSSLKNLTPESSWKKETRDVLLAQASNAIGGKIRFGIFEMITYEFKNTFSFVPKAAWGVICLAIILTGGTFSVYAATYTKPGDLFYTARVAKEKIQLAMTFDRQDKVKLDMKLASVHAKEISEVLSDPKYKGNEKNAAKLAQSFQQEIKTVKDRLSEINNIKDEGRAAVPAVAVADIQAPDSSVASGADLDDAKVGIGSLAKEADGKVVAVDSSKDSKGVQVYDPQAGSKNTLNTMKIPTTTFALSVSDFSSSSANAASATAEMNVNDTISTTLDKATESFNTKDFSTVKDILEQVGKIIDNIGSGEVKGANEAVTSTSGGSVPAGAVGSSSGLK